ncbi:MAG: hypothetical protein KDA47_19835 [Planctomycetales bacterium]|nr:hypothetical protein [Planctomycetales bacterium]
MLARFRPGDLVVYRKQKHSNHPGPRAREVAPEPHGELYTYLVEKFWVVAECRDENKLLLRTRRGKEHLIDAADHNLRRANIWERLFYRDRFRNLQHQRDAKSNTESPELASR